MKNTVYMADWYENRWGEMVGYSGLLRDFGITNKSKHEVGNILFAYYNYEDGYAYVFLEKNMNYLQVEAFHGKDRYSGLEGQWKPKSVDLIDLAIRLFTNELGFTKTGKHKFNNELTKVVLGLRGE